MIIISEDIDEIIEKGGTPKNMFRVQIARPDHYRPTFYRWMLRHSSSTENKGTIGFWFVWFDLYFRFYRTTVNDEFEDDE